MLHDCNYIVFDFETGGFTTANPVTQVALIVLNCKLEEVHRYTTYVKPYDDLELTQSALDFTHTTKAMLEEKGIDVKDMYNEVASIFKKYKEGKKKVVLIGHNAARFDMPFLHYIFKKFNDDVFKYAEECIIDTMTLSRLKWGHIEVNNHKLESACERAGIVLTDAHEAENDTEANADLFRYFAEGMRTGSNGVVGEGVKENEYEREFQF